jgi:hypothetical protein
VSYVERVDKAYDEFEDVYRDLEALVRTTDRLREDDRQLLLIALGRLYEIVELLSDLPTVDGSGRYIDEDFVIERTQNATYLLREVRDIIKQGTPEGLAEEELDVDVIGNATAIQQELLEELKKALAGCSNGGDK